MVLSDIDQTLVEEATEKIREMLPDLKVIFMSCCPAEAAKRNWGQICIRCVP